MYLLSSLFVPNPPVHTSIIEYVNPIAAPIGPMLDTKDIPTSSANFVPTNQLPLHYHNNYAPALLKLQ